jgi:hypothetical protein
MVVVDLEEYLRRAIYSECAEQVGVMILITQE